MKLQQKLESLESRISKLEIDANKQDQYNRRNNLEIQESPSNLSDDIFEDKVIQIFEEIDISVMILKTAIIWAGLAITPLSG